MYQFKVTWQCDDELITSYGIVAGNTFAEAMVNVARDFGEINIETCQLEYLNDTNCICYADGIESLGDKFDCV